MTHMDRFLKVYEEVQTFLLAEMCRKYEMDAERKRYLKQMMDTTCLGGKYNRGLCVVDVAEAMLDDRKADEATRERVLHDACVCGWMIEMLQAHFLVEDDIMDKSKVRRGKPCWYLHPGVTSQVAINDGLIVLAWSTQLAFHYFKERPFLLDIIRVFHETDMITTIGQLYDVTSMVDSKKLDANIPVATTTDYVEYTTFNYRRIVVYKTAYYTYWAPLTLGLLVSESVDKTDAVVTEKIAMLMGEYFQAQDDMMDVYTPPEKLGKIGTDIQDAKCSWLAATLLETAPADIVAEFKSNYGHEDAEKIAKVKELFNKAEIPAKFEAYEADVAKKVDSLLAEIRTRSEAFAKSVDVLWQKTYKRAK